METDQLMQVEQLREALRNLPRPTARPSDIREARNRRADSQRFRALCILSLRWQRERGKQ